MVETGTLSHADTSLSLVMAGEVVGDIDDVASVSADFDNR
jgi:hypothetical protein